MVTMGIKDFDVRQVAESGQVFRWNQVKGQTWSVVAFGKYLEITQQGEEVQFSCTEEEFRSVWTDYLDLSRDYGAIKHSIDAGDCYLSQAAALGYGVRVLKQELWEVLVSFMISQNNNIKRIRKSVEYLCRHYGTQCRSEHGREYAAFPTAEQLQKAEIKDLNEAGLGYRSGYVKALAALWTEKEGTAFAKALTVSSYDEAVKQLTGLYGVGIKVANCVCLYGLHQIDAFPIDTHIRQILSKYYPEGFPFERYLGYAGILQQYMFYYKLEEKKHK